MTAQDYIQSKLSELSRHPSSSTVDINNIEAEIVRLILSKKFRKYAISPEQIEHIKSVVHTCVSEGKPIQATLVFGGYKLWRLEESPETDWAELFSLMYYTKWMRPICDIYKPGVWFDYYSDEVIVPTMNNVPTDSVDQYQKSFRGLLGFIKNFQPSNLNMTLNRVGDQYDSYGDFLAELENNKKSLQNNLDSGLPVLDNAMRATLELNVNTTPDQLTDPKWMEKVQLTHDAYAQVSKRRPYYRTPDKFNIFTTHYPGSLSVGTTKDSVMKWWIGAGALKKDENNYRQVIYSPNQLSNKHFITESVCIPDLEGKNFRKIRVEQ